MAAAAAAAAMSAAHPLIRDPMTSPSLPQRIGIGALVGKAAGESATRAQTERRRIRTLARGERALLLTSADQQPGHPVVAFVAAGLRVDAVVFVLLPLHVVRDRPWLGPHGGIFDRHGVAQRV